MRLLHVTPTYLPAQRYGGPIQAVHGLCEALAQRGHDVTVFTTSVDGPGDSDVPLDRPVRVDSVTVRYFKSRWLRRIYWSRSMSRALGADLPKFDLVHLHSVFLWPTTAAARVAVKRGTPYILTPHGMLVPELLARKSRVLKSAWIRLFDRANLAQAAAVHVTSEGELRELRRTGLPVRHTIVVPFGVGVDSIAGPLSPEIDGLRLQVGPHPIVLFLGRVNWKKGLDRLISAFRLVKDARLVIAGNDEEGYSPGLRALATRLGVRDRVFFVGPVYGKQKTELLSIASVFALPSYSENLGIAALEALAAGCPVVLTPDVGLAQAIQAAEAGLVSSGEPADLAASIEALIGDSGRRQAMAERGRRLVREQFSWPVVARMMEDAMQQIL